MFQNLADQHAIIDEADDLHLVATVRTFERIDIPDFLDALTSGFRRDSPDLWFGDT